VNVTYCNVLNVTYCNVFFNVTYVHFSNSRHYLSTYMYTCTHAYIRTYIHNSSLHLSTYMYTCTHAYIHTYIHQDYTWHYLSTYMHTCTHTYVHNSRVPRIFFSIYNLSTYHTCIQTYITHVCPDSFFASYVLLLLKFPFQQL
jgi:hypothetical protein